jgi:Family of unknown function (DUF6232)
MAENVLYHSGAVVVTPTIARFGDTSYQIANIGSVSVSVRRRARPSAVVLMLLGCALVWLGLNQNSQDLVVGIVAAGAARLVAGIVWQAKWPVLEYRLLFKTSSGDVQAITSREHQFVADTKEAIEKAFSLRPQRA